MPDKIVEDPSVTDAIALLDKNPMPALPMQTVPPVPNASYTSQGVIQSAIVAGRLVMSMQFTFSPAQVSGADKGDGTWTPVQGQTQQVYIGDVMNLDEDLADLAPNMKEFFAHYAQISAALNKRRKVL